MTDFCNYCTIQRNATNTSVLEPLHVFISRITAPVHTPMSKRKSSLVKEAPSAFRGEDTAKVKRRERSNWRVRDFCDWYLARFSPSDWGVWDCIGLCRCWL